MQMFLIPTVYQSICHMIEYKIIPLEKTIDKVNTQLNTLAREGWRVVCSCGKGDRNLILKRKIKREIEQEEEE